MKLAFNFPVRLMLLDGGQHLQVYWQNQVSGSDELSEMISMAKKQSFAYLTIIKENTPRTVYIPNVIVPSNIVN